MKDSSKKSPYELWLVGWVEPLRNPTNRWIPAPRMNNGKQQETSSPTGC